MRWSRAAALVLVAAAAGAEARAADAIGDHYAYLCARRDIPARLGAYYASDAYPQAFLTGMENRLRDAWTLGCSQQNHLSAWGKGEAESFLGTALGKCREACKAAAGEAIQAGQMTAGVRGPKTDRCYSLCEEQIGVAGQGEEEGFELGVARGRQSCQRRPPQAAEAAADQRSYICDRPDIENRIGNEISEGNYPSSFGAGVVKGVGAARNAACASKDAASPLSAAQAFNFLSALGDSCTNACSSSADDAVQAAELRPNHRARVYSECSKLCRKQVGAYDVGETRGFEQGVANARQACAPVSGGATESAPSSASGAH